ncbi:MAG: OmpH family outer membrane protein [Schwartzia sp. (in: firmicutes)]
MKKGTKALLAGAGLFLTTVLSSGCIGERQATIGYFNAERIDQEAAQIKAIEEEANAKMAALQKEFLELEAKADGMSPEDMARAQQEQMVKVQAASQQYQMQIRQKIDVALDEIAKEKKLDAVLQNSSLEKMVVLGGMDITEDLIQKLK